jgi:hypothetical protein
MLRTAYGILLCTLAAIAGCAASPDDLGGGTSGLIEISPNTAPLGWVHSEEWRSAPAGCEGKLGQDIEFEVASADDGLVAAVADDGDIVCVDSVESVQEELESSGDGERAATLDDAFLLAAGLALPNMDGIAAGDPTPQPSIEPASSMESDDPSPQPSTQPR